MTTFYPNQENVTYSSFNAKQGYVFNFQHSIPRSDSIPDENRLDGRNFNEVYFHNLISHQLYHLAMCIVTQRRPVLPSPPYPLPQFNIELPEDAEEPSDGVSETSDSDDISMSDDEDVDNEESDPSPSDGDLLACRDTIHYDSRDANDVVRLAMSNFLDDSF